MTALKANIAKKVTPIQVPQGALIASQKTSSEVDENKDETPDAMKARVALSPVFTASEVSRRFLQINGDELCLNEMMDSLIKKTKSVQDGDMSYVETMLVTQAAALNSIFAEMARRASTNMGKHMSATESYMRMAFKAQNQCRATLETLAEIKSPRQATFVRQQNVANQQQVNNGT